jgi:hypothetical protein
MAARPPRANAAQEREGLPALDDDELGYGIRAGQNKFEPQTLGDERD